MVVHREAEQDHEQEHRQPGGDPAVRVEVEQVLAPAPLEHRHQHPVGGRDREQVQDDRLHRDHDRAERDQQQHEREQRARSANTSGAAVFIGDRSSPSRPPSAPVTAYSTPADLADRRRAAGRRATSASALFETLVRAGALRAGSARVATVLSGLISTSIGVQCLARSRAPSASAPRWPCCIGGRVDVRRP